MLDTNIFKLHSYNILRVSTVSRVNRVSKFCGSKNTINVIAKYHMTERSRTALLTHTVKLDASDVI